VAGRIADTSTQFGNSTSRASPTPLPLAFSSIAPEMVETRLNLPSSHRSAASAKRRTPAPRTQPRPNAASTS
jgi:hypothetical protein